VSESNYGQTPENRCGADHAGFYRLNARSGPYSPKKLGTKDNHSNMTPGVILALSKGQFMAKRILRGTIKCVAVAAALVFIFDNKDSGSAGIVGAIAVLFLCFLIWQIFDLGASDGFRPDEPKE